jgi:FkbM family methyltransferase
LRFNGVIDVGCADGAFSVGLSELGPARNAVLLNVDAQEDYRDSLASIQAVLGGHYRVCAVGERDGTQVTLQRGAHEYWSSLRDADDRYWRSVNNLRSPNPLTVTMRTLDSLIEEVALPAPYLLKMDIQGGEAAALAGAPRTLAATEAVLVEVVVDDFAAIHRALDQAGFILFDIVDAHYTPDVLSWFYAVYLSGRHADLRPASHWNPEHNQRALAAQAQRRNGVRGEIAASLERFRAGKWAELPP